jgi:hypothetical protein
VAASVGLFTLSPFNFGRRPEPQRSTMAPSQTSVSVI